MLRANLLTALKKEEVEVNRFRVASNQMFRFQIKEAQGVGVFFNLHILVRGSGTLFVSKLFARAEQVTIGDWWMGSWSGNVEVLSQVFHQVLNMIDSLV